jgi:gluconokinase
MVLVLDLGSSSTRALLYDEHAQLRGNAIARQPFEFRAGMDGRSEDDPDAALSRVETVIDEALSVAQADRPSITAIGISAYACSLLCLDARGNPLTPVFTYADTRAAGDARALRSELDEMAALQRTGCRIRANYWPARLAWLQRTQPDVFSRTRWFVSLADYLSLKLFGQLRAGISTASWTGMIDRQTGDWDEMWLAHLGIARDQLPPVAQDGQTLRGLAGRYASRWPALRETACYPPLGDGAAANIGSGCIDPSRIAITIGSTAALRVVVSSQKSVASSQKSVASSQKSVASSQKSVVSSQTTEYETRHTQYGTRNTQYETRHTQYETRNTEYATRHAALPPALWSYRVDHARDLIGGATTEGGNVFAWLNATLKLPDGAALEAELSAMRPDGHGLTVLPMFGGERSPGFSDDARATLHGLSFDTTPAAIARACMESIAFRLAAIHDALREVNRAAGHSALIASGGALLHSAAWRQIIADVTGAPVQVCNEPEATGRGAALLALHQSGILPDLAALPARLGQVHEPDTARHATYRSAMQRQAELYRLLIGHPPS